MIQKVTPKQPPFFDATWKVIRNPQRSIQWLADAMDGAFFENALGSLFAPQGPSSQAHGCAGGLFAMETS